LIQRYPIDAFGVVYDEVISRINVEGCRVYNSASWQGILYSAICYYYNRVIQFGYEQKFGNSERAALDQMVEKGAKIATCLLGDIKADAASLYFARAFVYNRKRDLAGEAQQYASEFLVAVDKAGGKYYAPSHVEAAKRIAKL